MSTMLNLTRPELKRQREALLRYERYLPMLKLKQQQLQLVLIEVIRQVREAEMRLRQIEATIRPYRPMMRDLAGVAVESLGRPAEILKSSRNVAGVSIPVLTKVVFEPAGYSLFATPPWVDQAIANLRKLATAEIELLTLEEQKKRIEKELQKIAQRVNLFEKVKIPGAREALRRIRIRLGDEMAAGVGRAKIAKARLAAAEFREANWE